MAPILEKCLSWVKSSSIKAALSPARNQNIIARIKIMSLSYLNSWIMVLKINPSYRILYRSVGFLKKKNFFYLNLKFSLSAKHLRSLGVKVYLKYLPNDEWPFPIIILSFQLV